MLPHVCAVLASDAAFFYQSQAAIQSIRAAHEGEALDVRLIAIGELAPEQREWLRSARVGVFEATGDIPRFKDAPAHTLALSCRPYLPSLFPDADGIVWIDSDIRFLEPTGLAPWLAQAKDPQCPLAAAHEGDKAYCINYDPNRSSNYEHLTGTRLGEVHGPHLANYLAKNRLYNAGLFAMPSRSPVWDRYRVQLERALTFPFDRMREQDALNVAISEAGVRPMPSTLNWLCGQAIPVRNAEQRWTPPDGSGCIIEVVHLTNSGIPLPHLGAGMTMYEYYRSLGLT